MEYNGRLYGRINNRSYFFTGKTTFDWDALEKRIAELEAENQVLRQQIFSPLPTCEHNFIQKDAYWKSCSHCGVIAPLQQF